ncbi:MAG: hypothetical protein ABIQ54_05665 [Gammaproteobacteria bacterium]
MHEPLGLTDRPQTNRLESKVFSEISPAFIEFKKAEIEQSIPTCFEQRVQRYADQTAIKTQHHCLTYAELNRLAKVYVPLDPTFPYAGWNATTCQPNTRLCSTNRTRQKNMTRRGSI